MVLEDFGVGREKGVLMKTAGRGGASFLCCFSWGCWVGSFTRRTSKLLVQGKFLDGDQGAFGAVDGVGVEAVLVVVIRMILHLHTQGLILGRDMVMEWVRPGDRDSGLEHLEALQQDTWLGTEETDKSLHLNHEAIPGLEARTTPGLDEPLQAPVAHLQDMRAQVLDQHHEGNWVICGIF
jgi:hypothetical protein